MKRLCSTGIVTHHLGGQQIIQEREREREIHYLGNTEADNTTCMLLFQLVTHYLGDEEIMHYWHSDSPSWWSTNNTVLTY